MAGEYLPPVVTELLANIDDVAAKVEEAKGIIESLGDISIPVNFDINDASLAKLKADAQSLASTVGRISLPVDTNLSTASLLANAAALKALNDTAANTAPVAAAADGATRLWGTGIQLTTLAVHGLVSGFIEWLAVAIPGTIALGAASFVAMQGAANLYDHLSAMYTTTEATANIFGKTTPQILGMGDAMQQAQNAANPMVYQWLGAAINIVRENAGNLAKVGLDVNQVFDTFAAKLVYDFSAAGGAGKTMNGLLSNMEPDLIEFGQILGNMGHGLADFAADMPGAANMLLSFFDAVSKVVSMVADLPAPVITAVMALHELNTWGSIGISLLGRLGFATSEVEGSFFGLARAGAVLQNVFQIVARAPMTMVSNLGSLLMQAKVLPDSFNEAGAAMRDFGADATDSIMAVGPLQASLAVLAAAGLGVLIDKLVTAKTAEQSFIDSINAGITSSSNLQALSAIALSLGKVNEQMVSAAANAEKSRSQFVNEWDAVNHTSLAIQQLTGEQSALESQFTLTSGHAAQLAQTYNTTFVGALALASAAGVKLQDSLTGKSWAIAQFQINDYVRGMMGMGQTVGAVGSDVTALAIDSQLSATKVSQLNQAWDQFMTNITSGTGDLASVVQSIQNIGQVVGDTKNNLGEAGSIDLTTQQFANALKSMAGSGAQAWTNFDQVIGSSMPQLIDWLRTAGAEGAITGPQFSHDILDMAASMEPLASKSAAAQAELLGLVDQAGLNIKTFPQLESVLKSGKYSLDNLSGSIDATTVKMANMGQVAATLGADVQNDFISQMASAIIKSGTLNGAMTNLIKAEQQFGSGSSQVHGALSTIQHDLQLAGVKGNELKQIMQGLQTYMNSMHGPNIDIATEITGAGAAYLGSGRGSSGGVGHPVQMASGGTASPGWAMVGERGPELIFMRGGEHVVPNNQLRGYADGTGDIGGDIVVHMPVYLDGKQIAENVSRQTYNKNFRNGSRLSGGRPTGNLRPR